MTLNFYASKEAKLVREQYLITPHSFGPFTDLTKAQLKEKMMLVQSFEIEYHIRNEIPTPSLAESDCYDWSITQHFDYNMRSEIRLSLEFYKLPCGYSRLNWRKYPWVNALVMVFALISMILQARYLLSIQRRYEQLRLYYNEQREKQLAAEGRQDHS